VNPVGAHVARIEATAAGRWLVSEPALPFVASSVAVIAGAFGRVDWLLWCGAAALAGYALSGST
jgi:hypothetical protein